MASGDETAIRELYARYNRAIDCGDAEVWADTFVKSGIFHHPARDWSGHDELRRFIVERTAGFATHPVADQRHWNDAHAIAISGDHATCTCDLLVSGRQRSDGSLMALATGHYSDVLERTEDGWKFSRRRLTLS